MPKKTEKSPLEVGLRKVRKAQEELDQFVYDHRKTIEEYLTLTNAVESAKGAVKPLCVKACESDNAGRHAVAEFEGMRVVVQVTQSIDVESLLEEFPKLRKVAQIKQTMVIAEGDPVMDHFIDRLRLGELTFTKQVSEHRAFGVRYECTLSELVWVKLLFFPDESRDIQWQASLYVHPTKDVEECEMQVDSPECASADEAVADVIMRFKSCRDIIAGIKI